MSCSGSSAPSSKKGFTASAKSFLSSFTGSAQSKHEAVQQHQKQAQAPEQETVTEPFPAYKEELASSQHDTAAHASSSLQPVVCLSSSSDYSSPVYNDNFTRSSSDHSMLQPIIRPHGSATSLKSLSDDSYDIISRNSVRNYSPLSFPSDASTNSIINRIDDVLSAQTLGSRDLDQMTAGCHDLRLINLYRNSTRPVTGSLSENDIEDGRSSWEHIRGVPSVTGLAWLGAVNGVVSSSASGDGSPRDDGCTSAAGSIGGSGDASGGSGKTDGGIKKKDKGKGVASSMRLQLQKLKARYGFKNKIGAVGEADKIAGADKGKKRKLLDLQNSQAASRMALSDTSLL